MRYVLANKGKAVQAGFSAGTHYSAGISMMLNEREVDYMLAGDSLEEKVKQLGGKFLTDKEAELYIKEGGLA